MGGKVKMGWGKRSDFSKCTWGMTDDPHLRPWGLCHTDDDLYNLTDDESIEVPLVASDSVKKQAAKGKSKYPPLIIPPPEIWPLPPKKMKASACSITVSPTSGLFPDPAKLAVFNLRQNLRVPSRASTPSLDGSLTSEELAASRVYVISFFVSSRYRLLILWREANTIITGLHSADTQ